MPFDDKTRLFHFHIVAEAKIRALVVMFRKYHPDWNDAQIKEAIINGVDLAIKKGGKA